MKNLLIISIFLTLISNSVLSQEVEIEIDKTEYKITDQIRITFHIDFDEDDFFLPDFKGFKIVGGPSTSTSTSITNGVTTQSKSWNYVLRPIQSGTLIVKSPIFIYKGKTIKGKSKSIHVIDCNLSEKGKKELRFKSFIEDSYKPEGTYRYMLNEEFGYIEIHQNSQWKFHRRLTQKEFEIIKTIK